MFEHVADSEQTSVECPEGPDGSYLVASPFLISCLHFSCRKSINPFGCSIFRRGSPTAAALSPARAAGSASKAVPFLFFLLFPYCFQIFGMWCFHHLTRSWCSNRIFVVFVWILCSSYSVAQQATYTVQACAGLSGRIKAVDFHCTLSQFLPAAGSMSRLFSA